MKLTLTVFLAILFIKSFAQQETLQTVSDRGSDTAPGREIRMRSLNPNKYLFMGGATNYARIGAYDSTFGFDNLILNKEGGNVGIGTSNPSEKLTIYGTVNSAPGVLALESSRNDAGYVEVGSIRAKNADGEVARIGLLRGGGSYTGEMNFMVKATNEANLKEAIRINQDGNIGIGTTTPQFILSIKKMDMGNDLVSIVRNSDSPNLDFVSSYSGSDDLQSGSFGFGVRPQDDAWQIWSKKPSLAWENLFSVKLNGNVGIGTVNPQDKLTVAGTIGAREIKVSTNAGADFVFEPGYKLTDLTELEKFVKTNKHLPEIPTAKQMVENGVNLGELNIKLLQKVEELTLHLIEKDKELKKEKELVKVQNERLQKLESKQENFEKILKNIMEKK